MARIVVFFGGIPVLAHASSATDVHIAMPVLPILVPLVIPYNKSLERSNCFEPGSGWTIERCCTNGGLADCFNTSLTYAECCPSDWEGMDPLTCFHGLAPHQKLLCCTGDGISSCFGGRYTFRACCESFWARRGDPLWAAIQATYAQGLVNPPKWDRGAFFARVVANIRPLGSFLELGVQRGGFSRSFLSSLQMELSVGAKLPKYYLVDIWRKSANFVDMANIDDTLQRNNLKATVDAVAGFWQNIALLQLPTRDAAGLFRDQELGFIYIDARHDYCAVSEDLNLYWPKLRNGGLLAGDDFAFPDEIGADEPGVEDLNDWEICEDGSRRTGGVKQAVLDFSLHNDLELRTMNDQWLIWKVEKR